MEADLPLKTPLRFTLPVEEILGLESWSIYSEPSFPFVLNIKTAFGLMGDICYFSTDEALFEKHSDCCGEEYLLVEGAHYSLSGPKRLQCTRCQKIENTGLPVDFTADSSELKVLLEEAFSSWGALYLGPLEAILTASYLAEKLTDLCQQISSHIYCLQPVDTPPTVGEST